jgi:myo-inositol-1(or 4)-monophosphatase
MNDQRLMASGRSEPDTCMIATHLSANAQSARDAHMYKVLYSQPYLLRSTGSLALDLAYVAAGRYDGMCCISYKRWDVSAGLLLVREAGGLITECEEPGKTLLFASNERIHGKLATALSNA